MFEHELHQLHKKMDRVIRLLEVLLNKEIKMNASLDTLTAAVKANTDAEQSAITLIQGLAQQLKDAATDPVAVSTLADQLNASASALAAAVVANTPAAPPVA